MSELAVPVWPTVNASLNGLAGVCLLLGYFAIKRGDRKTHNNWMLAAFGCSTVFLASYVTYHATKHVITRYPDVGFLKILYLLILVPHTILAVVIVPFIIMAIRYAIRGEFAKHTKITKWLFPAWAYVSVTGVVIYLMLYVFRPAG